MHTFIQMTRTAGTNSDRTDTIDNIVITQSGGTNYQSMVADIGDSGPVDVQSIHWTFTFGIKIDEIMCYAGKRVYASEIITP